MPEGPTLLLLREEAERFTGRKVLEVGGNSRLENLQRMKGKTVQAVRTWGKHFLLEFKGFSLKIHFMLFGSYRIDERRENSSPRLTLRFTNGELNFYASSVRFIEQPLDEVYDWGADVLSDAWDPKAAKAKLRKLPNLLACDALLEQSIFSGVGNIIKNEVLFRIRVSPLSTIGALPPNKLDALVAEARNYSFDFLAWRRIHMLTKNLLVHRRSTCPECGRKLRVQHLGRTHRRAFWCEHDQPVYGGLDVQPEPMFAPRKRKARKPVAKPAARAGTGAEAPAIAPERSPATRVRKTATTRGNGP